MAIDFYLTFAKAKFSLSDVRSALIREFQLTENRESILLMHKNLTVAVFYPKEDDGNKEAICIAFRLNKFALKESTDTMLAMTAFILGQFTGDTSLFLNGEVCWLDRRGAVLTLYEESGEVVNMDEEPGGVVTLDPEEVVWTTTRKAMFAHLGVGRRPS